MIDDHSSSQQGSESRAKDRTTFATEVTHGLGELEILHPAGTFALTPASLIALQAIWDHQNLLAGTGIDWGTGTGSLAIAAARIPGVHKVIGLEISDANVKIARENAHRNGVEEKVEVILSDSYSPRSSADHEKLESCVANTQFILANPPSSEGDDGFGYRREVLSGARKYLTDGGVVFLSVSLQYGLQRVDGLVREVPGAVCSRRNSRWSPISIGGFVRSAGSEPRPPARSWFLRQGLFFLNSGARVVDLQRATKCMGELPAKQERIDSMKMTHQPIVRKTGEGRTIGVVGDVYRFLATGEDTNGKYALWEAVVPPGGGPPPHIHSREEEGFYVLEGEISIAVGEEHFVVQAGMFANMPVGSLHSFKNESDSPARMLISVAPAGLERMFFEVGQPLRAGATTAPRPTKEEIERLLAVASQYGVEVRVPKG